jgi:hypothetical protein
MCQALDTNNYKIVTGVIFCQIYIFIKKVVHSIKEDAPTSKETKAKKETFLEGVGALLN